MASPTVVFGWFTLVNLLNNVVNDTELFLWIIDVGKNVGLLVTNSAKANCAVVEYMVGWIRLSQAAVLDMLQLDILRAFGEWRGLDIGDNSFVSDDKCIVTINPSANQPNQQRHCYGRNN